MLVAGPSGSGKSITASAFLIEGARVGETGVIAAFEQRPNKSRGRAIAELIESGRIGVINTRVSELSVDEIATLLIAEIQRLKASRNELRLFHINEDGIQIGHMMSDHEGLMGGQPTRRQELPRSNER